VGLFAPDTAAHSTTGTVPVLYCTNRFQRYSDGLARICMGLGAKVSEYF